MIMKRIYISILACAFATGCGSQQNADRGFFTSGSREADQRAEQRMAKTEQLRGQGEGAGAEKTKASANPATPGAPKAEAKKSLYDRLGGEEGIKAVVDDFVTRALADPRVNFERKGVKRGGFSIHYNKPVEWNPTKENVDKLKLHLAQFITLATGGPPKYEGGEMKPVHAGMHITNPEFDAAIGDLKASLDKFSVPNAEQKELLAIVESTRPQVVEER